MALRKNQYKDMEKFRKTRNAQRKRYYQRSQKYPSRLWTEEEDTTIMTSTNTDVELSDMLSRSVGSIQSRRWLLNKREREKLFKGESLNECRVQGL